MSHEFVFREKFDRSTDGRMNVTSVNGKIADRRKGIRSITNEVLHGKIVMIMKIGKTKKEKSKKINFSIIERFFFSVSLRGKSRFRD